MRRIILTFLLSSVCTVVLAEENSARLDTIVVTAPRLSAEAGTLPSSQLITGEALDSKRLMTNDSAQLLDGEPGVSFYTGGGVSSLPVIDGLADDRLRISVNGMTITSACPNHMNPSLSYMDPASVGKISVMAGITPVSLGGDSIGGTISITSAEPVFATPGEGVKTNSSISAFTRSNGNVRGGNVRADLANEKLSLTFSGATVKSDNYEDANGDEVKSTEYESQNNLLSLATRIGNGVLSLDAGWQNIPYQGYANQYMDMTSNESNSLNARYKTDFDWGQFTTNIYRHYVRHKMDMLDDKANLGVLTIGMPYAMPMDTEGVDSGYALQANILASDKDVVRVGHEFHHYTLDDWWPPLAGSIMMEPNTFWNINNGKRDRLALFAEWETKINSAWSSQLGARYERVTMNTGDVQGYYSTGDMGGMLPDGTIYQNDADAFNARNHKITDDNIDLTAVARYEPDKNSSYDIGLARKTRSPNLYERFAWSNESMMAGSMISWFGDLNAYVGNLDLKPEVAHTLRATLDWHDSSKRDWQFKADPFYTHADDYINVQPNTSTVATLYSPANPGRAALQFVNHEAELYGVDLTLKKVLGEAAGEWSGKTVVNYVHGKDLTNDDNLYNIMPLNARLALAHKLGAWSNNIELQAVSAKTNVDAARKELETAGYTLWNLRSSYDWKNLRLDLGIENLLNKQYALPLGGLDFYQYNYTYAPSSGINQIRGMGRSINVGLTASF